MYCDDDNLVIININDYTLHEECRPNVCVYEEGDIVPKVRSICLKLLME